MNLRELVQEALDEDLGKGDLTTEACVPHDAKGAGVIRAKQPVIVCGHAPAAEVFRAVSERVGGQVSYTPVIDEGQVAEVGDTIATVEGTLRGVLVGERLALNFLMRLCGIATHTRKYVDAAAGGVKVVDTRKTTPLHRSLEKHAVRCGGGMNHRFGLNDGVMVKDNHIRAVGSLGEAVRLAREGAHHVVRVEVEVASMEELRLALDTDADVIMLDNFPDEGLAEAVTVARAERPGVILEASGNMSPERIAAIRELGLDFVSAGGLIHQARWADLSLSLS